MIAVILAAGPTNVDFYKGAQSAFLQRNVERVEKEMKQIEPSKCLFKYRGEILLERQVRLLRECGVEHIKIITNYKEEMIEEFDKSKKLGLEFIHNPDFRKPFVGLRAAMEKEGNYLLIFGDGYFTKNTIERLMDAREFTCISREHLILCKILDTTEFLVRYATALTYGQINRENTGSLEILYNMVTSRGFDPMLFGLYSVFFKYGTFIADSDIEEVDLYELTDDYTERWGVVDHISGGLVTSIKVKQENHSPIIKGLENVPEYWREFATGKRMEE